MESEPLRHDLARLTAALWSAVATLGGGRIEALCRRLGDAASTLRRGELAGGRRAFAQEIETLGEDDLEAAARAHALECHLMNTAEERERLRALHAKGGTPPDGVAAAIDGLIDAGFREKDLRALFDRALVMPVITAHPTESRRRSSRDHLTRIAACLDRPTMEPGGLAPTGGADDALEAEVLALHATEDARVRRPTPLDEVETALEVFRRSLLAVTPRIYRTIEDRLALRLGGHWRLPCFLRWGTWVGGDRDGNPNVTAAITRAALQRQRQTVLARYLHDVEELGRTLSISSRRAKPGALDDLIASIEHDRERLPEVAAHARPRTANEPWREKLWYVQARLRATLEHGELGYVDAARYRTDLDVLDRTLRAAGFAKVADQELRDALRRVDVFGFHLASLDIRQHSAVHDRVVGELLARGGRPGYLELDEAGRRAVLDGRARATDRARTRPRGAHRRYARAAVDARRRRPRAPRARNARVRALRHELHPRGLRPARGRVPRARRRPRARRAASRFRCSSSSRTSIAPSRSRARCSRTRC